ncbi:hypothetical protein RCL1_000215 [Eukaryota sp. TZLM3-RCL]
MEIELKLTLDESSYSRIVTLFAPASSDVYQTNHYFQLDTFKFRLRLLQSDNLQVLQSIITVKGNPVLSDGVIKVTEDEEIIPNDLAQSYINNPHFFTSNPPALLLRLFPSLSMMSVQYLGSITNHRMSFVTNLFPEFLEIDCFLIKDIKYYELECEATENRIHIVKEKLLNFLSENDIPYRFSTETKMQRLLCA